ncbi:disulfide bond formation protein B [Sagittula sp. S175]|uniref:disulfide bond formation protein B n=1 Tax=Sagittula sp. S175 TaxID=3415129 RepID=UPI003C7E33F7
MPDLTTALNRKTLTLLATLGSAALILGAWGFQYIGGMAPCKLCYWQRYGHFGAILFGLLALFLPNRLLLWLGAAAAASSSAIAIYHTGVERKWWLGPQSCTGSMPPGLSPDEMVDWLNNRPVVVCDVIPWEMFGLSMANYNIAASAVIAILFIWASRSRA